MKIIFILLLFAFASTAFSDPYVGFHTTFSSIGKPSKYYQTWGFRAGSTGGRYMFLTGFGYKRLNEIPDERVIDVSLGAAYVFKPSAKIHPYLGGGYNPAIYFMLDQGAIGRTSVNYINGVNLTGGVQFLLKPIVPFVEYRHVFYFEDHPRVGSNRRAFSVGVLFVF